MKPLQTIKWFIIQIFFASLVSAANANEPAVIPQPQKIEIHPGHFYLTPNTKIFANAGSLQTAKQLAVPLRRSMGYSLPVGMRTKTDRAIPNGILLTTKSANPDLGAEGYELIVTTNSVIIRAPTQAGLFYGVQTLLQLLPAQIFSSHVINSVDWQIPCLRIEDWPRFKWRGLMLDVSRHFFDKAEVERLLDLMALYKLNHFHWHLTDDQGWRIQIKKYPKLTQIGAWRDSIGFGLNPKDSTAYGPDGRYGGFYTQDDIREVVAYAAARHITVVPEIEMPGHSLAALVSYPQFGAGDVPFTIPTKGSIDPAVYSPAKEGTFQFLDNVLTEVFALFPSKYIHIGGDEVPKGPWKNDPACQALMKREGLKNEDELQSWFIRRIEKFVNAHGKTLIGWSEILKGGLAENAVVMDWIGGGKEAASKGHDVVMTPTGFCYFDHYQSLDHSLEPRAAGSYLPLQRVYSFEPVPTGLSPQEDSHILGGQANLWTEFIASTNHLEYMIFPRLCALAEVVWSSKEERNWDDFQRRLKMQEQRLSELGVNFRRDHSVKIGDWTPNQIKTNETTLEWNVATNHLVPGKYHAILDYTHGSNGISISAVSLTENGHEIAHVAHTGFAGSSPHNPVYILDLLNASKTGAHYILKATVKGKNGTDSYGTVSWVAVPEK